jgi:hypothetical protein
MKTNRPNFPAMSKCFRLAVCACLVNFASSSTLSQSTADDSNWIETQNWMSIFQQMTNDTRAFSFIHDQASESTDILQFDYNALMMVMDADCRSDEMQQTLESDVTGMNGIVFTRSSEIAFLDVGNGMMAQYNA